MIGGIGQMIFSIAFNFLLMMLFAPKPKDTVSYGPRLDNLKPAIKDIQGQVINLAYGTTRISGTVFWASTIRETVHSEKTEYDSKGMDSSYTHTDITYTYDCDLAVGICEGPIVGIKRIWANKELIYDADVKPNALSWLKFSVFDGSETQGPSVLMQAALGYSNVSAHRGLAYVVFEQFQLDPFGRRVPQAFEFEVVAKGTTSGTAKRFTQVSSVLYGDGGNSSGWSSPHAFFNSENKFSILQFGYTDYIIPVTNQKGLAYVKLNAATGYVDRFYPEVSVFGCPSSGYYEIPYWGEGVSSFAYFKVSFMGTGYRYVPCLIFNTSIRQFNGISYNYMAVFFVVNLVNNRVIGSFLMPDCIDAGSFLSFARSGVYNNSITNTRIVDGYVTVYSVKADDLLAIPPTGIEQVDEYGMVKLNKIDCAYYNKKLESNPTKFISSSGGYTAKFSYHCHLIGFPNELYDSRDISECTSIFDTYTIETNTYTIEDIFFDYTAESTNVNAVYENYTHSIIDEFEQDKVGWVKIKRVNSISEYKCRKDVHLSTTSIETTYIYPCTLGDIVNTADEDPTPPDTVPPYDPHVSIVVKRALFAHYVVNDNYKPQNGGYYDIQKWIKFKNGDELISLSWRNDGDLANRSGVFRKGPHSSYLGVDTSVDPLEDFFGYYFYKTYDSTISTVSKIGIYPNKYYKDEDYRPIQYFPLYGDATLDVNNSYTAANKESPFSLVAESITIPTTAYWDRGLRKIYYMNGTNVMYYDLITNSSVLDFTTTVTCHNIMPYAGDYIGTYIREASYSSETANIYYISKAIDGNVALLGEIVEDISTKANISLGVLDISESAYNTEVYGFNISDDIKLYDAIESVLMHYFIDAFESDWKIKFRTRKEFLNNLDGIPKILDNELGVKQLGENYNEKYRITLREDTQLPQSVSYTYIAAESGFTQANVIAMRNIDFNIGIKTSVKCPMALKTTEAYSNAFRILFDIWRATKEYDFRLPRSYSYLEPGDVILLPLDTSTTTNEYAVVKITEITAQPNSYLELKGVEEDARNLEGVINDGAFEPKISTLIPLAVTDGFILDSYPLYNKFTGIDYNIPGIYAVTYGSNASWRGGSIFTSYDGVAFYPTIPFGPYSAAAGQVIEVTNNKIDKYYIDSANTITIQTQGVQEFYSVDDSDYYYREGNLIAIYKYLYNSVEYIQFNSLTRDTINPEILTFYNLTRGMYNTDSSIPISKGDKVALIPLGTQKLNIPVEYYNKQVQYKLVSFNQNVDTVSIKPYVYKANWYLPYNVAQFKSTCNGTSITLTWINRERNKPQYLLYSPEILDTQEYTLKIYNEQNTLIRTVTGITTTTYTYSAIDMATDGVTINNILRFVLQRKATFLEYNHTVVDTVYHLGYNKVQTLQNMSDTTLALYISGNNTSSTTIVPEFGNNLIYNNYSGLGYVPGHNGITEIKSMKSKKNDFITGSVSPSIQVFTLCFWVKINTNSNTISYAGDNIIIDGSDTDWSLYVTYKYNGSHRLNLAVGFDSSDITLTASQLNTWIFCALSFNSIKSGKPVYRYVKDINGTVYVDETHDTIFYNYYVNNYTLLSQVNLDSEISIQMQDLMIFSSDLYDKSGENSNIIDGIYNLGAKKWHQR